MMVSLSMAGARPPSLGSQTAAAGERPARAAEHRLSWPPGSAPQLTASTADSLDDPALSLLPPLCVRGGGGGGEEATPIRVSAARAR